MNNIQNFEEMFENNNGDEKMNSHETLMSTIPEGFNDAYWRHRILRSKTYDHGIFKHFSERGYKPYHFDSNSNLIEMDLKGKFYNVKYRFEEFGTVYFLNDEELSKVKSFVDAIAEKKKLHDKQIESLKQIFEYTVIGKLDSLSIKNDDTQ